MRQALGAAAIYMLAQFQARLCIDIATLFRSKLIEMWLCFIASCILALVAAAEVQLTQGFGNN